jgi:hypothetical protein
MATELAAGQELVAPSERTLMFDLSFLRDLLKIDDNKCSATPHTCTNRAPDNPFIQSVALATGF